MIYLDSSALLKLVVEEPESQTLGLWLTARATTPTVSSELAKIEVIRAARRIHTDVVPAARALVAQLDLVPLGSGVIEEAVDVGEPGLRSLDALHLASALSLREHLTAFVAYDHRLILAVRAAGLPTQSPGA